MFKKSYKKTRTFLALILCTRLIRSINIIMHLIVNHVHRGSNNDLILVEDGNAR